jgi:hypothetical protein
VASSTYHIGPWALGVRSSRVEFDEALRRVLAPHLLDVEAPANFSVVLADDSAASPRTRAFNFLYRANQSVVKSRVPGRVLRALLQYLSDFAEPVSSTLRIAATGVLKDGRAIVAPPTLRWATGTLQPRLNAFGMQLIDAPVVHIEPGGSELVVPEPLLHMDANALAEFETRYPGHGHELPRVGPGRYPIVAWALVTHEQEIGPLGRAHAVAAATQNVLNADTLGPRDTLDSIARCLAKVPPYGVWWREPRELVQQLTALANGA